jgi:hypothetical protein
MFWIAATPTDLRRGLTRRDWLRVGVAGGLGLLARRPGDILAATAAAAAPRAAAGSGTAKSCILIYLFGGVSQLDVWDLKPAAPDGIRGEFKPIPSAVPGIQITEHLPRLARHMDKIALVRSMAHGDHSHGSSAHRMLTGYAPARLGEIVPPSPEDYPHYGAVVTELKPARPGVPSFVSLPWTIATSSSVQPGQGAGFLGRGHDPLRLEQLVPEVLDFTPDGLRLPDGVTVERLRERQRLRERLLSDDPLAADRSARELEELYRRAFALLGAADAADAFNLTREPVRVRERYGMHTLGQSLLMARRLAEAGVPLITVYWPARRERDAFNNAGRLEDVAVPPWDTHGRNVGNSPNFPMLKDQLLPPLDNSASALIEDLAARGLLDQTLVVFLSEFGRSPRINGQAGRDHWGKVFSIALAGGGIRGGQVYGSSDKIGSEPADKPVSPGDFAATMYHCLGIPPEAQIVDQLSRPHRIADGRAIESLLG